MNMKMKHFVRFEDIQFIAIYKYIVYNNYTRNGLSLENRKIFPAEIKICLGDFPCFENVLK